MKTITINIPDTVNVTKNDILMTVAASLYNQGTLSLGQAADLANVSKHTFAELLGQYGVSLFNQPVHELGQDLENAAKFIQ